MTEKKHFELQEYDLPEVGDDDILVKVEAAASAEQMLMSTKMTRLVLSQ